MEKKKPNLLKWALKYSVGAAFAGILCCVAPAILFMFGLMSGVYAISFADFFYLKDGSTGPGAWCLRTLAFCIGIYGVYSYRNRQNQCNIEKNKKRKNLVLITLIIFLTGICVFLSLEKWSTWYFDKYIVPAQKIELNIN